MRGHMAEGWTNEAFDKLRWSTLSNLVLNGADVDHVVLAPSGVLSVETKYRHRISDQARLTTQRRRDLAQTRDAARKTASLIKSSTVLGRPLPVTPVLITWGTGAPSLPDGYKIVEGVYVLDGDEPELWSHLFRAPVLTDADRDALTTRLRAFQDRQAAGAAAVSKRDLRRQCRAAFAAGCREANKTKRDTQARRDRLRHRHRAQPGCSRLAEAELS